MLGIGVPSRMLEDAVADMYWNYIVPSVPSVPSGMLEDAGQGHIPESLPRPRWVGQHMQAYPTTIYMQAYHTTIYSPIIAYLHHCSALM